MVKYNAQIKDTQKQSALIIIGRGYILMILKLGGWVATRQSIRLAKYNTQIKNIYSFVRGLGLSGKICCPKIAWFSILPCKTHKNRYKMAITVLSFCCLLLSFADPCCPTLLSKMVEAPNIKNCRQIKIIDNWQQK